MASVHFEQVSHRRPGDFDALIGFDLAVDDGDVVAFVGTAGSGAATALRLLAGFEDPDRGRITIGTTDVAGIAPRDRNVALVLPHHALYPGQSALDHLLFPLVVTGVSKPARERRLRDVAEQLGLCSLLALRPDQLTPVERQRVALGRAIVRHPDVLLMDDPIAGLDAATGEEVCAELVRLCAELGTTTIAVVPDRDDGLVVGRHIVEFERGRCRSDVPRRVPA